MSNVKPGDLARIVRDPDNQGFLGAIVVVLHAPSRDWRFMMRPDLVYWECQMLESRHVRHQGQTRSGPSGIVTAGSHIICDDSCLRRIDPPADTEQLYSTAPIEGEDLQRIGSLEDAKERMKDVTTT